MRGRENPFTLIEMLVVITIIAILMAMTSPSLMKALGAARLVACGNNLKQIGTAMTLYADDYRFYPAARPRKPEMPFNQQWWYFRILPYTGQAREVRNWADAAAVRTTGVFNCPEAAPVDNLSDCHFSMNTFAALARYFGFSPAVAAPDTANGAISEGESNMYVRPDSRCTKVPNSKFALAPSSKIVFVSELGYLAGYPDVRDPFIRVGGRNGYMDQTNPGTVVDGFKAAFRHNGRKDVLWFDLHVSTIGPFEINYYLVHDPDNS